MLHVECDGCQRLAEQVQKQFRAEDVFTDRDVLVNADRYDPATYPGLVFAIHQAEDAVGAVLRAVAKKIMEYRRWRVRGLSWLLAGEQRLFHEAGVIHVVAPRAVLDHRLLARPPAQVCARHCVDAHGPPVDLIQPYLGGGGDGAPDIVDHDVEADSLRTLAGYLGSWEITDIRCVRRMRQRIEDWRQALKSTSKFPALGGFPVHGRRATRLDFILEDPDFTPPDVDRMPEEQRKRVLKKWNEDGARIWRLIEADLVEIVPTLTRPGRRANTKGAQCDLHDLYAALCALDDYMDRNDESEWPSLPGPSRDRRGCHE